ncbi:MAG: hypothetical protein JWR85_1669 [Marmoricola sp.]|nr:hypothetical protein [Marmoricola sp.]
MDDDEGPDGDRSAQVRGALLKALAVVVVIGVVIALGTTIVVRALGLNESDSPGPIGAAPSGPVEPLPTTALPVPGEDPQDAGPTEEPSASASADAGSGDIELEISPVNARPGERVNLTGSYRGADNLALEVQRFEDGAWQNFGVDANVRVGTYATYVMTQRTGEMRFRMYDPQSQQGSNVVLVTIG